MRSKIVKLLGEKKIKKEKNFVKLARVPHERINGTQNPPNKKNSGVDSPMLQLSVALKKIW